MYYGRYCARGGQRVVDSKTTEAGVQIGGMNGSMRITETTTSFKPDFKLDDHPYAKDVKTGKWSPKTTGSS